MPADRSAVLALVRDQARRRPEAPAVRGAADLSYGQLVAAVDELASRIHELTEPGCVVALDAADPLSGVLGILATAQSGNTLLPLDRQSPPAHRDRILGDARPSVLLREAAPGRLDAVAQDLPPAPDGAARVPADTAYIMYTSGSTGAPKGVLVSHAALHDRLAGLAAIPGLAAGETVLAMTALSFDICLAELLLPLTVGATIVSVPAEVHLDPYEFADFLELHRPDVAQATPSFWRMAVSGPWTGSPGLRVWCGGEPLTPALAGELLPRCGQLWNLYGPTEATVWATAARVSTAGSVTLGRPLPGTGVLLTRQSGTTTRPLGEPGDEGEVTLWGAGLATGYLGDEDLTRRRFRTLDTGHGGRRRCYLTGDLGRYGAEGEIEFLGRTDTQVKIRGHRVELGAVEAVLEEHPAVSAAIALLRDGDRPERAAVVAVVAARGRLSERELRVWLKDRLPASHRPQHLLFRDRLPHTTAGKVDRVALRREAGVHG
ncbi:MAG: amino acid adenylation domain-containing protein [Kitasatospora sp.]|jgi:amino acid adenylation domain-containing protein|nr:amino acid adenylation domain-containing protein [Kitasatospora sp.]